MRKLYASFKAHPVKTSLRWFCYSIVIFIYAFFIIRIFTMEANTDFLWTKSTRDAYQKNPDDFNVYSANIQTNLADDGKFAIYDVYYVPQAKQLQLTIRYNKSTVKDLKAEKGIDDELFPEEPFLFVLRTSKYDAATKTATQMDVIAEYIYTKSSKGRYNDRTIIFENVDLIGNGDINDPSTWEVTHAYVDPYFVENVDVSLAAYANPLLAYDKTNGLKPFDFSGTLKDDKTTSFGGFVQSPAVEIKGLKKEN